MDGWVRTSVHRSNPSLKIICKKTGTRHDFLCKNIDLFAKQREERFLLPGDDRRPADVLMPHWSGGRDAAMDVTVVTPLQTATMPAAATLGHALTYAYDRKIQGAAEDCRRQGIAFFPLVAETFGGWHSTAEEQVKKLGSALARHTGQVEGETIAHIWSRLGILLQRGNAALLGNRVPELPLPAIDGIE